RRPRRRAEARPRSSRTGTGGAREPGPRAPGREESAMAQETLSITDNRTRTRYELPIEHGPIRATDLPRIPSGPHAFRAPAYDPAFMNPASCKSAVTFIDGDRGILRYRGYPIEQLAEQSSYLETAYLLIYGELPTAAELEAWRWEITHHTWIHENLKKALDGFHHDAHPMAMLVSAVAPLSTVYPDANHPSDAAARRRPSVPGNTTTTPPAAVAHPHTPR